MIDIEGQKYVVVQEGSEAPCLQAVPPTEKKSFFSKYDKGAEFDKCDVKWIGNTWMLLIKAIFAAMICTNVLVTYLMNLDGLGHMFYFFSYWGDVATLFAVIFQLKAS